MASRKIEDCDPILKNAWNKSLAHWLVMYPDLPVPFLTCTYRSDEEQTVLYNMNKNGEDDDGDGKVDEADEWRSNAKAGESKHNLKPSKAFDIAFKNKNGTLNWSESLFSKFACIIATYDVDWGGDWKGKHKDTPHFEI